MKTGKLRVFLLVGLLALSSCREDKSKEPRLRDTAEIQRPNILFIPIDDLRPELGCYGNNVVKTPNIDKLASHGVVFNRAYCQQAVCTPSRTSLLTGLRPDSTRVWDLGTNFRDHMPDLVTLPQFFKNNGYYTVGFGKTFHNIFPDTISWNEKLHVDGFPFDPDAVYTDPDNLIIQKEKELRLLKNGKAGFDHYGFIYTKAKAFETADVDDDDYYDGAQTTMAIKKLGELKDRKQPFFLSIGFYKPHLPLNAPEKYWDLYNSEDIPLAPNPYVPKGSPLFAVHGDAELRAYTGSHDLPKPQDEPWEERRQREIKHAYYACVSYIDTQVGRLLEELDRLGLRENTIVVLWGDHGWKLGEHNSWAKMSNYEIDTRVPLIISGKGVKEKGKTSNSLTEFVDVYPTLCDLAGFEVPEYLQGKSLNPLLKDVNTEIKDAAYSQFLLGRFGPAEYRKQERMGYTVRTDRYRYMEWYHWDKNTKSKGELIAKELFDHENDPRENINIAKDPANKALIAQMHRELSKGFDLKD
ncbi:sulfatase [Sinomicrobium kalidii]|uniref:sulfatase n=1 Tax=Sinomicrobium kalidii TaxID=2900738 RepID=UPI001E5A9EFC|nr:sulfatase [Sinomicrobium kalidii]UGU17658.1 sulfatase [Sinomicrobium kalidii]